VVFLGDRDYLIMAHHNPTGNGTDWKNIEARLLRGDKVRVIADDEGLKRSTFANQFKVQYGRSPTIWAIQQKPALEDQRGFGTTSNARYVNEHYFDNFIENPTPDKAYVLGILYGRPVVRQKDCFQFASRYEELVDIVRNEFESKHKPTQLTQGTSLLRFTGVHHLYQTLLSLGFGVKAKERPFPEVDESVLSHFMRGIVEANSSISFFHQQHSCHVQFLRFGISFLTTMNSHLQQYAGVPQCVPNPQYCYSGKNGLRIRDFIYQGTESLEDTGLYVPDTELIEDIGLYVPEIRDRWFKE